jgi:Domain of unknown function (DUF6457)
MDGMDVPADQTDAILAAWTDAAAAELHLTGHELTAEDRSAILDLAGVAAHKVLRPAAPLTTFLAGYAAGLRSTPDGSQHGPLDASIAKLTALAERFEAQGRPGQ